MNAAIIRAALVFAVAGAAACSLTYDWDPDELPCRPGGLCDEGFTCLGALTSEPICVRDGSRSKDTTCDNDKQCEEPLDCVDFVCRKACGNKFYSTTECESTEFCKPFAAQASGYCVPSQCGPSRECPQSAGTTCVSIKLAAYACLNGCEIVWQQSGDYADNCGGTPADEQYCQAVGRPQYEEFVCLDVGPAGQPLGADCSLITQPCEPGLTCYEGRCAEFCNPEAVPGSPGFCPLSGYTLCCEKQAGTTTYGICADPSDC